MDWLDQALDGDGGLTLVQSPVERPAPIVRPGEGMPRRAPQRVTQPSAPAAVASPQSSIPQWGPGQAPQDFFLPEGEVERLSPQDRDAYLKQRNDWFDFRQGAGRFAPAVPAAPSPAPQARPSIPQAAEGQATAPIQANPAMPGGQQPRNDDFMFEAPAEVIPKRRTVTNADLTYDPNRTMGFIDQAKGSFAATDDQWLYHAARTLYPNEKPETAIKRFGKTEDGRAFHRGDDGQLYEVQPPRGWARLANAGEGVGPALPAVSAAVSGIMATPYTGGLGTVAAAGGGGYAGDVARQYIGNKLLGGPEGYSTGSAIKEGVVGALGQGIGNGINRIATRGAAADITQFNPQATQQLYDQAARVGVRLTPAEATGLQSLVGEQTRLQASPRAANTMQTFGRERTGEVTRAWDTFLDLVGTPRDAGDLGRSAREVAQNVIQGVQGARTAAVQPFYDQAERQIGTVNPGNVVRAVELALEHAKGSDRAGLRYVLQQLQRPGADGAMDGTIDMSFRGLNNAKMAIDAVLQNEDLAMKQGIDRTAHATLERVRHMLIDAIEAAPGAQGPGGSPGPYAAGRALYGEMTRRTVDPAQEVLAPLLRANPNNSTIVRAAQAVLDPATRTPDLVTRARAAIAPQHPEIWGSMVRQFLHEHAYAALQENAKGNLANVGGNIAKRVGNDKMEAVLQRALTPTQLAAYRDIVDVFRATARAVDANSDTAFKQEAIKLAKNNARGPLAKILNNINPAQAMRNFSDAWAERNYERTAARVADIFASGDRDAITALRQLRQLGPADVRRRLVIGHFLGQGADVGAEWALE